MAKSFNAGTQLGFAIFRKNTRGGVHRNCYPRPILALTRKNTLLQVLCLPPLQTPSTIILVFDYTVHTSIFLLPFLIAMTGLLYFVVRIANVPNFPVWSDKLITEIGGVDFPASVGIAYVTNGDEFESLRNK